MTIPEKVIHKLDAALGVPGQPHHILIDGQLIDTGCFAWTIPTEEPTDLLQFAQELENTLSRVTSRLKQEQLQDVFPHPTQVQELLKEEPLELQAEFAELGRRFAQITLLNPFDQLRTRVRQLVEEDPVIAYTTQAPGVFQDDSTYQTAYRIVVAPTTDQYDILRIEQTDGANYGLRTEDIIDRLRILDEEYGIDIIDAGIGSVVFILKHVPQGEEAQRLGKWLLEFCPDLYEAPEEFPDGKIELWWD